MILHELAGGREDHPVYRAMEAENGSRQYDFLRSIVSASIGIGRPFFSQQILKALNYHAIACLHYDAGVYRPCGVTVGEHRPPDHYRVPALMDDFVNEVNRVWDVTDAVALATYVLWRLNNIHPFINGNGRTARAACYFVLCLRAGGWLPGDPILPELIRRHRDAYCQALQFAHVTHATTGNPDLRPLHAIVVQLVEEQLRSAGPAQPPPPPIALPAP
ncbi:Fic family protein [Methylobacterium sp. J-070]|uniref:Fic family protein n=1 Tax=Methylobacterium sp. J-070 TaxID=2836650 RepID=UPI001FBB6513|nr:Fic family protein [Methylobacterium sp. J-070]MCJ2053691.1 Fic family protein [Methylobacterium sp. J-070]